MSACERAWAVGLPFALIGPGALAAPPQRPAPEPPPLVEPTPIRVPPALAAHALTIEPSGVVWAPSLERYLVVSDDTDDEKGARHLPWVLAMSRQGAFDEAPVPIRGVDEINDAESICAGPGGAFFLTTSHSPNRKGHTRAPRRMLLLLEPAGRALGSKAASTSPPRAARPASSLFQIAGLPPMGRLDIEAITYQDGALLIGLKCPLSSTGGAVILRLAEPVAALKAGALRPAPSRATRRSRSTCRKAAPPSPRASPI